MTILLHEKKKEEWITFRNVKFVGARHYIRHQILHVLCDYGVLIYATYSSLQIVLLSLQKYSRYKLEMYERN